MSRSILLALVSVVCASGLAVAADTSPCADCHDDVAAAMANQIHMRIEPFEVYGRQVGCEGCHGDGTQHMEEGDPALIRTFAGNTTEDASACLDCHSLKGQAEWHASTHALENINCLDCHSIHKPANPVNSCKDCHQEVFAQFQLPSHHPVPEGKMGCMSCHDPHAGTESQLNNNHMRLNDLCYTCHQNKEGPFIFEHAPVVEDCSLCHSAHGTVANNLQTVNEPTLCLQCHEFHFHAGLLSPEGEWEVGGQEFENPAGEHSFNRSFTTKCTQCHSQVHGTDLPSQSTPGAGQGMVR
jgi:DmsE family decaheme c-type cytochrome